MMTFCIRKSALRNIFLILPRDFNENKLVILSFLSAIYYRYYHLDFVRTIPYQIVFHVVFRGTLLRCVIKPCTLGKIIDIF